jgi:hypothetical protein
MLKVTWPQVLAFWLQRHFLEERPARGNLLAVVRRLGNAAQAGRISGVSDVWPQQRPKRDLR